MGHVGSLTRLPPALGLDGDLGAFLLAAAFAVGGFLAGALAEALLARGVAAVAARSRTPLDDAVTKAFRGPIRLFLTLIGVLLGLLVLPALAPFHGLVSRLLDVAVMLALVVVAARLVSGALLAQGQRSRIAGATRRLLRRLAVSAIYVVGLLVILENQGISITPLLTTLGLAGLAAALALQDTLANFFAGLYVQADKPLDVGHRVRFEDLKVEGTVVDVGWRTTKLRTLDGNLLVIPNVKVAAGVVVDYDLPERRTTASVPVRVAKGADPRRVAALLEETARGLRDPGMAGEPRARFTPGMLAGGGFELTLFVETTDVEARERVAEELRYRVVDALRQAQVDLA